MILFPSENEAPRPKGRGIWDFVLCTTSAALDCDKGKALDPRKIEYFVRSKNILFSRYEKSPQGARYETQME